MFPGIRRPVASLSPAGICLVLLLVAAPAVVRGEALILIHGYLSDASAWHAAGITTYLEAAGWRDAGELRTTPAGVQSSKGQVAGSKRFYTVALPTEAGLLRQLHYLEGYMAFVRQRHPYESLTLVGHSAGGVLARLYIVRHPGTEVSTLITIASPHLGTGSAEVGALAGESPLAILAPLLGGSTLSRSQALYRDLMRERPGSLLFWLNRQPHPMARYISVVRREDSLLGLGDLIVPIWSQDMNNVHALRGRVSTLAVSGLHGLQAADGQLLLRVLRRLQSS